MRTKINVSETEPSGLWFEHTLIGLRLETRQFLRSSNTTFLRRGPVLRIILLTTHGISQCCFLFSLINIIVSSSSRVHADASCMQITTLIIVYIYIYTCVER
ncbi:hypothetical protein V8G54_005026 [Vigna mungo]|uniref:Uncharacterized protein n=1 Tax=Vigna mungo TaxID=3915 RepID=A0AAQ3PJ65_VIGMU